MREVTRRPPAFLLTLLLLYGASAALPAQEKTLHWNSLAVAARLDSGGRLEIVETHEMVFTGDWNGGERGFRLEKDQKIVFRALTRVGAASGERQPLSEGDLSQVDHYAWTDSRTLRWRSRLPSDPPFENTAITYVLEYTLSNLLVPREDGYLLDHDFAFRERPGPIERFSLDLALDPVWRTESPFSGRLERAPLPPGESAVVTIPLRYAGEGRPAGVRLPPPLAARILLAAALFAALFFLWVAFLRRQKSLGLFEPLPPVSAIDEAWLQKDVFSLLPEVVGAAWDDRTSAPEVAAVIARMVQEGKIASEVRWKGSGIFRRSVLSMTLRVDRKTLEGYEAKLVKALFFDGDATDTEKVRAHYRSTGFDPVSKIRGPVEKIARAIAAGRSGAERPSWWPTLLLFLASFGLLLLAGRASRSDAIVAAVGGAAGFGFYLVSVAFALHWRSAITRMRVRALGFLIPMFLYALAVAALAASGRFSTGILVLLGLSGLCVALFRSVLNAARCRQGVERVRFRRNLAAARRYFEEQLRRPEPDLQDSWFPYLVAFGLGARVDRWFRAFGAEASAHAVAGGVGRSSGGSFGGSSSGGWTGGGGSFGGAGASGAWSAAAGSLAAGVAAPSSGGSGGGGGGGGGGGSSGGGSGGGW